MKPVDPEKMRQIEKLARDLFSMLDVWSGGVLQSHKVGAALFLFSFEGKELTYVSNANREDMVKTLIEFINANSPPLTWDEQHG